MANNTFRLGFAPEPQTTDVMPRTKIAPTATSGQTVALFINSPVLISAGTAIPALTGNTDSVTGSVLVIKDANGVPCGSLAANTAGTVEYTYEPDQVYRVRIQGTQFAAADLGKMYNFTAETATVATTTSFNDSVSARRLDGTTEAASGRQIQVIGIAPPVTDNDPGVTGTAVLARIVTHAYAV